MCTDLFEYVFLDLASTPLAGGRPVGGPRGRHRPTQSKYQSQCSCRSLHPALDLISSGAILIPGFFMSDCYTTSRRVLF